jgi:hypothetical protein
VGVAGVQVGVVAKNVGAAGVQVSVATVQVGVTGIQMNVVGVQVCLLMNGAYEYFCKVIFSTDSVSVTCDCLL